jgi:seryl-tRNA synthetase
MLDIKLIREHPDLLRKALESRGLDSSIVDKILALDLQRLELISKIDALRRELKIGSKEIGKMKKQGIKEIFQKGINDG